MPGTLGERTQSGERHVVQVRAVADVLGPQLALGSENPVAQIRVESPARGSKAAARPGPSGGLPNPSISKEPGRMNVAERPATAT
jgi:hypothetical protein